MGKIKREKKQTNCPNCGAPLDGVRCPYCNTPTQGLINIPIGERVDISIGVGDVVYEFEMITHKFELTERSDDAYYSVAGNKYIMPRTCAPEVGLGGVVSSDRIIVRERR